MSSLTRSLLASLCIATYASAQSYSPVLNCSNAIPKPTIFGANITSLAAQQVPSFGSLPGNDVCILNVTLTHSGTGDGVNTFVVLPLKGWNGRFQGVGGGGWAAGNPADLAPVAAQGYAGATTDAGIELSVVNGQNATAWALLSTGNVNQHLLYNFARRSMHDMTLIGKAVSESFYGRPVFKSYWNGCSTGGRQGMVMAQYYPDDYDGIMANAPAIQWTSLATYGEYLWSVLTSANYFPDTCELQAVADAVVAKCDTLDGLKDNIISAPGLCRFEGKSLLGKNYTCSTNGTSRTFAPQIAPIVDQIWAGPKTPQGDFLWYGLLRGTNFSALYLDGTTGGFTQTPVPFAISDSWIKGFLAKDYSFDTKNISLNTYADLFLQSHLEYDSIIGTANPNLRRYKERGGKIITWQGLADQVIPPQQTILYYNTVQALDPNIHDFYRLYFSPGTGHCAGGIGTQPIDPIAQLRAWVENGTSPDTLKAGSPYKVGATSSSVVNATQNVRFLDLCQYPLVNKYDGKGDPNLASSYCCEDQRGWETFPGPRPHNSSSYNYYVSPGWYGGDSDFSAH